MKPVTKLAIPAALIALVAVAIVRTASAPPPDLKALYDRQQWADLRAAGQVSELPTFYRGVVDAVFNADFASADANLRAALDPPPELEWQKYEARALLIELHARAGRYREALDHIDKAMAEMPNWEEPKEARPLYAALVRSPAQSVASHEFAKIPYRMKSGIMFVPLEVNGKQVEFFVDTGAAFSVIGESEARRLGLTIIESDGATVTDAAQLRLSIRPAVADELKIGNTRLRNVFFMVVADEMQPFPSLAEGERGVIGFPVLVALQRIHWNKAGEFEIGFASPPKRPGQPNLFFRGLRMYAELRVPEGRVATFIDSGSTHTIFLPRFAADYPQRTKLGVKKIEKQTGASGSVDVNVIRVADFPLWIGDVEASLSDVTVQLDQLDPGLRHIHLTLGMDLMSQLAPVTFDFEAMTFSMGR